MTNFSYCSFPESKLSNLDFSETVIKECDFVGAVVRNSMFYTLKPGTEIKKSFDIKSCI